MRYFIFDSFKRRVSLQHKLFFKGPSRSIRNRTGIFWDHIIGNNIDICTITETRLKQQDDFNCAELDINGYATTENRQVGGNGILHRSSLTSAFVNCDETSSFEFATWKLITPLVCMGVPCHI